MISDAVRKEALANETVYNQQQAAAALAAQQAAQQAALLAQQQAQAAAAQEATTSVVQAPVQQAVQSSGTPDEWMAEAGISPGDYGYVDYIISRESGWNPNAQNASSGAGGLPQALPYSKTGCVWGDAVCQLGWATSYADNRYGSWAGAYDFWVAHSWW